MFVAKLCLDWFRDQLHLVPYYSTIISFRMFVQASEVYLHVLCFETINLKCLKQDLFPMN